MPVLAAMAPTLAEAIRTARTKAYVVLDGTLVRIDRVAMASGNDRATGTFVSRPLSGGQKAVNRTLSALRAPSERANADLKNWRILRKVRSSPAHATTVINAVQTLMING